MNQKGNLMLIVVLGLVILAAAFVGVYMMTMQKQTFTPPNLSAQNATSQAAMPSPTVIPAMPVSSSSASPAANLSTDDSVNSIQQDLNSSNSTVNSIDQPAPSVLGIETSL